MQALLEHFITQSTVYSLLAVMLVAFLESLALVGLILPGTVMMAGLGALIGGGEVNFWQAWLAGIVGCLLGDWISFWLGWRFKKPLHRWSFMKKNRALLEKTEHALHQHSMITILIGRFVGPTRPLVPMVAGMLDLPVAKFVLPNIIGCLLWPPLYFLPGILAGAAIDIPADENSASFKWLLLGAALLAAGGMAVLAAVAERENLRRSADPLAAARPTAVAVAADGRAGGYSVNICLPPSADAGLSGDPAQSHRALIPIKCEALLWPLNSSAVAPSQTMRPSATTIERGAMRAASSTLWETISRVSCCCSQTSATVDSISWRSAGSSAEKGSSSSSTGCWRTRQRASAARCR